MEAIAGALREHGTANNKSNSSSSSSTVQGVDAAVSATAGAGPGVSATAPASSAARTAVLAKEGAQFLYVNKTLLQDILSRLGRMSPPRFGSSLSFSVGGCCVV